MTNPMEAADEQTARDDLERRWRALEVDPRVVALSRELRGFNVFEAMGATRGELRHSAFLAQLLDPRGKHGLGDRFVRALLAEIWPGELDGLQTSTLRVYRERWNIDILLVCERPKLAIIIENKVDSGLHSDQLQRYRATLKQELPSHETRGVFLTKSGEATPESRAAGYDCIGYGQIARLVRELLAETVAAPDVAMSLEHYVTVVERHLVPDSSAAELARQIYEDHRAVLDVIFAHRPGVTARLAELTRALIADADDRLVPDEHGRDYIRFRPRPWLAEPRLSSGSGWTSTGALVLFEVRNRPGGVSLALVLGPGPDTALRTAIRTAVASASLGGEPPGPLAKWCTLWSVPVLSGVEVDGGDGVACEERLREVFGEVLATHLDRLTAVVLEALPGTRDSGGG